MPAMYEQLRQEAADRDGMITKEDKAQEKAADIERMKRRLFESNKSTDPRLVSGIVCQSVPSMTTVGQPALTSTTAAGEGSRGNRKPPPCQQGMTPATGFPCPRLPSPGDRRHPIDHSVPFEDPKRVTKKGV